MQFEPATFTEFEEPVPPRGTNPPNPYDPVDAVFAAARMLCADGGNIGDLTAAIFSYNYSAAYVDQVWSTAVDYGMATDGSPAAGVTSSPVSAHGLRVTAAGDPQTVVAYARRQLGVPYVMGGGETPRILRRAARAQLR